jgi:uncharacterized protein (TIGR00730 family)
MKTLCVYCGSNPGTDPAFLAAAKALGARLGATGKRLVYGGGRVGLMGAVADAALAAGAHVTGIIPRTLMDKEVEHRGLSALHVVGSMHERKMRMADLSDGFIALPGGVGTMEELFEVWTWNQLGLHAKPIGLLDVAGYYRPLLTFIDSMVERGFVRQEHRAFLRVETDVDRLLVAMEEQPLPQVPKWLDRGTV